MSTQKRSPDLLGKPLGMRGGRTGDLHIVWWWSGCRRPTIAREAPAYRVALRKSVTGAKKPARCGLRGNVSLVGPLPAKLNQRLLKRLDEASNIFGQQSLLQAVLLAHSVGQIILHSHHKI